jgi:chromosomal replication initiator protein
VTGVPHRRLQAVTTGGPKVVALHEALEETRELIHAHIDRNIRELQAVLGHIAADRGPLESHLAEIALRELIGDGPEPPIHAATILEVTADYYGYTTDDIRGRRGTKPLAYARQVTMYLCRELAGMSMPRIGDFLIRDHTTVMHADRKIRRLVVDDPVVCGQVQDVTVLIKRRAVVDVLRGGRL